MAYSEEIRRLEEKGMKSTQVLSDMPRSSGINSKIEDAAVNAVEVSEVIQYAIKKREREKVRLLQMIANVEDTEMRLILFYRYLCGMRWQQVAEKMNTTEDSVKGKEKRFFKKIKK